jgi:hypothetical protein
MTSRADRYASLWIMLPLGFGVLSTTVTVLGYAWLSVWLQFFGERADRGDYAEAAGVLAGGLGFLALATATAWLANGPRWLQVGCWALTGVMLVVMVGCLGSSHDSSLEPADSYNTFGDGLRTALSMPWSWVIVAAFLAALAARYRLSADRAGR